MSTTRSPPRPGDREFARAVLSGRRFNLALAVTAVLAFMLRAAPLMRANGVVGTADYDEGVYVGAAALLTKGFMPYRDFGFVHPPGIAVLLFPIVWIGNLFGGYSLAFAASRWTVCVVGGLNTYFVGRISLRWLGKPGALAVALLYATFFNAVLNEGRVELEPFLNAACLIAALSWLSTDQPSARRCAMVGAVVGAAASIKLYGFIYVVPILATATGAQAWAQRRRVAAAAAAAFSIIVGPFVLVGGVRHVWDSIVVAQINRPRGGDPLGGDVQGWARRLAESFAYGPLGGRSLPGIVGVGFGLLMAGLALCAWFRGGRHGRFWVMVLVLGGVVFLRSPSFFETYPVFLAPAGISLLAFGIKEAVSSLPSWRLLVVAASTPVLLAVAYAIPFHAKNRYLDNNRLADEGARIQAAIATANCVYADPAFYALAADRLPDPYHRGGVIDSFGDPFITMAERNEDYSSPSAARLGLAYQDRLRAAISACGAVVLNSDPSGRSDWSSETQTWFADHYKQVLPMTDRDPGVYLAVDRPTT